MKSAFPLYLVKIFENTYNILWTFGGVFAIIVYRRACDKSALYGIVGFFSMYWKVMDADRGEQNEERRGVLGQ